jgi:hypothetical protein
MATLATLPSWAAILAANGQRVGLAMTPAVLLERRRLRVVELHADAELGPGWSAGFSYTDQATLAVS